MQDTIFILEEGNRTYPRCPQCDTFVPQKSLKGQHPATEFCGQGMERKWSCLAEEESRTGIERVITAYGYPLSQVTSFKYLGQVIAEEDNDWPSVVRKLRTPKHKWARHQDQCL